MRWLTLLCVTVLCAGCASSHREVTPVNAGPVAVATVMPSPTPMVVRRLETNVPGRPPIWQSTHFFPSRPQELAMRHIRGIVTQYGIGMGQGHVVLRTHAGTIIDFYVGYPLKINGVRIRDPFQPSDLVLGKTTATVTYWTTIYQQKSVHATDQIDY